MIIHSRRASVTLYVASCPICGKSKIVLSSDVRKNGIWTCTGCGHCKRLDEYDVEYDREVLFEFRVDGVKVYDDMQ